MVTFCLKPRDLLRSSCFLFHAFIRAFLRTSPLLTNWVVRTLSVFPQGDCFLLLGFSTTHLAVNDYLFTTDFVETRFDFNGLENKTTKHFSMLSTKLENVFTVVWLTHDY